MKRLLIVMMVIAMLFTVGIQPVDAKAKHHKCKVITKVIKKVHCPYCGNGKSHDCPYWLNWDTGRHMTDAEIDWFLFTESHYQTEDGEWHVR